MVLVLIMIGRGWDVNHYRFIQSTEERSIKPKLTRICSCHWKEATLKIQNKFPVNSIRSEFNLIPCIFKAAY